jgi:molybdopterin converting factor subunit 1
MIVRVKLFAIAKERAGREELTLNVPRTATIADVREAVRTACPALSPVLPLAMWSVDMTYANEQTPVTQQSEIAMIPPVSGG